MGKRNKTWLLVANASRVKIVEAENGQGAVSVLFDAQSDSTRARPRELGTDRPGRIQWRQSPKRGAMESRRDFVDEEVKEFLNDASHELVQLDRAERCDSLVIVAPARVARLLKEGLAKAFEGRILDTINKDFTALEGADLISHVVKATERWLGPLERDQVKWKPVNRPIARQT